MNNEEWTPPDRKHTILYTQEKEENKTVYTLVSFNALFLHVS